MSRFTVVIVNRFADEQTVARIRTYKDSEHKIGFSAKELAESKAEALNELIDNDIYFADVEEEETDEN